MQRMNTQIPHKQTNGQESVVKLSFGSYAVAIFLPIYSYIFGIAETIYHFEIIFDNPIHLIWYVAIIGTAGYEVLQPRENDSKSPFAIINVILGIFWVVRLDSMKQEYSTFETAPFVSLSFGVIVIILGVILQFVSLFAGKSKSNLSEMGYQGQGVQYQQKSYKQQPTFNQPQSYNQPSPHYQQQGQNYQDPINHSQYSAMPSYNATPVAQPEENYPIKQADEMEASFCGNCGTLAKNNNKFCPTCGSPL